MEAISLFVQPKLFACLSTGGLAGNVAAGWATDACGAERSTAGAMALSGAGLLLMAVGGKPASGAALGAWSMMYPGQEERD